MVYLNILIGLGVVLVSAAAAIYFSWPPHTPPYRQRRRNEEDDDAGEFDNGKRLQRNFTQQQMRRSEPGDKCPVCHEKMSQKEMEKMKCGHALHNECFEEYRFLRRDCLLCNKTVNPSLPGDICSICPNALEKNDMVFLRCYHAMHKHCYSQFINSGAKFCSLCGEKL